MIRQNFEIEIITPCFCAGADQGKAEIRSASIRGQLRWWFRLISQNRDEESRVFGCINDNDKAQSSAVCIRTSNFKPGPPWLIPVLNPNTPENYVWHFASVSGTTTKGIKGPRWSREGAVAPQSTFTLNVIHRRSLSDGIQKKLDLALHAFMALGTIGLRGTRGLGSLFSPQALMNEDLEGKLTEIGFVLRRRTQPPIFQDYHSTLRDYASWLKYDFRKQRKATQPSPLGSSSPRQTSAVRFRPIKMPDGKFSWIGYEAPHQRILGSQSRTPKPFLADIIFQGPAPIAPPSGRRY